MKIAAHSKLVFIGDSITDAGRAQPNGEGLFGALGAGYVAQVDALLGAVMPERMIRVVNKGSSGHTVRDLRARWEADVIGIQPNWLAIMIGINDVWRQFDLPWQTEIHVGLDEYEATLDELIARSKPILDGLVLMTPYYLEPNKDDAMRAMMDRYGAVVKKLAAKHDTLFVDVQAAFDRVLKTYYPGTLAWDRVHPGQSGHMVIAKAFLDTVGFQW